VKGQYLAVETAFTFGLGLMVAIGVIGLFQQYSTSSMDGLEEKQVKIASSEILNNMRSLKQVDSTIESGSGLIRFDIPERIGGKPYTVRFGNNLSFIVGEEVYYRDLREFRAFDLEGSVDGGEVTILKDQNNFKLRSR
jgi:hypothetical protein